MCCQMNTSLLRDTMAEIADDAIEFVYCFGFASYAVYGYVIISLVPP